MASSPVSEKHGALRAQMLIACPGFELLWRSCHLLNCILAMARISSAALRQCSAKYLQCSAGLPAIGVFMDAICGDTEDRGVLSIRTDHSCHCPAVRRRTCLAAGMTDYVTEPILKASLVRAMSPLTRVR
jgi:hypothetical protein